MQTKKDSLIESLQNVLVGLSISMTANALIFPLILGVEVKFLDNLFIGAIMTVISISRSYCIRRYHNWRTEVKFKSGYSFNV